MVTIIWVTYTWTVVPTGEPSPAQLITASLRTFVKILRDGSKNLCFLVNSTVKRKCLANTLVLLQVANNLRPYSFIFSTQHRDVTTYIKALLST